MLDPADFQIVELGDPRLREPAQPVAMENMQYARDVIAVLEHWMTLRGGVGIAAPQLGIGLKIMIVASRPNARYPNAPEMDPLCLINPEPIAFGGSEVALWEGCLSVPGIRGRVTRPEAVTLRYVSDKGKSCELNLEGFPARIFQHEYDHLIGKTFVDRVSSTSDLVTDKVYFEQIVTAVPAP